MTNMCRYVPRYDTDQDFDSVEGDDDDDDAWDDYDDESDPYDKL